MEFGCSKEPSHRDGSFEYPQYMFWLRNKKNNFQLHTLIWRAVITSKIYEMITTKILHPQLVSMIGFGFLSTQWLLFVFCYSHVCKVNVC